MLLLELYGRVICENGTVVANAVSARVKSSHGSAGERAVVAIARAVQRGEHFDRRHAAAVATRTLFGSAARRSRASSRSAPSAASVSCARWVCAIVGIDGRDDEHST